MVLLGLRKVFQNIGKKLFEPRQFRAALSSFNNRLSSQQYSVIIDLLIRSYEQAASAIQDGDKPAPQSAPWELSHGLAILGQLKDRPPLPVRPEELSTKVLANGGLLGCKPRELLDYSGVTSVLHDWLKHLDRPETFKTNPAFLTLPNDTILTIFGNWKPGIFEYGTAPLAVAKSMEQAHADYSIGIGGRPAILSGESQGLISWPNGKLGTFKLNSSHEMYSGGKSYSAALKKDFFLQQNTSYFALQNDHLLFTDHYSPI